MDQLNPQAGARIMDYCRIAWSLGSTVALETVQEAAFEAGRQSVMKQIADLAKQEDAKPKPKGIWRLFKS